MENPETLNSILSDLQARLIPLSEAEAKIKHLFDMSNPYVVTYCGTCDKPRSFDNFRCRGCGSSLIAWG